MLFYTWIKSLRLNSLGTSESVSKSPLSLSYYKRHRDNMYIAIEDYWARLKGKNPSDKFQKKKKNLELPKLSSTLTAPTKSGATNGCDIMDLRNIIC
jgi:DNA-binding protein Fis